jgi:hypothetical protein
MQLEGVKVVSFIPGRLRLRLEQLKGNAVLCERAQREIMAVQGIKSVETNPGTGSILLLYDSKTAKDPAAVNRLFDTFHNLFPAHNLEKMRDWLLSKA